ncbi:MAG: pyridoxamine 5'-phosphate oxidase [Acidimicrobiales bacterium]|nr:pyridoxamine 5'-phosphate oxidase [Acidimicrobiales bacterium]
MPSLETVRSFLAEETGLAVVSTVRSDGSILSSVVNCGVIDHPVSGEPRVALVSRGGAARLGHIRKGSQVTATARRGWKWVSVAGPAELIGPDDNTNQLDQDRIRVLLRDIFTAAGGTHDDWEEYDRAMRDEGRTAVLIEPKRILGRA